MENLKISIITVVKNGMPFLIDAINSYDAQTYLNKEHIIIYSPSNDGTEEYLKKIKNKVVIKDNKSINRYGSLNVGMKKSKGDVIGILHADDILADKYTLKNIGDFFENTNSDIVYGNIKFCKKKNTNKITRTWESSAFNRSNLKYGWVPTHTSIYIRRNIVNDNLYPTNFPISGDYQFILNLFLNKNYLINFLNKTVCIMRMGGDSTKLSTFIKKLREDLQISKKKFKNYRLCIFFKIIRKIKQLRFL
jgi:glycosyltransferase involved in cell wall biosynthesis